MKTIRRRNLNLHRETLRRLTDTALKEIYGRDNGSGKDVTYGGQAMGCPTECCTSTIAL